MPAIAVGLALVVAIVLWKRGGASDPPKRATSATAVSSAPARAPTAAPSIETAPEELAQPQPSPIDPATAPPLNAPVSEPAPPQKPFTRDETIAKREADLKLLDDTRTRLEKELASAQAAGDATAVHDLQIRIKRVTELRSQRTGELDKLRAGGELPK